MKHLFWLLLATSLAMRAAGQSNAPVKLAIVAETGEASAVSDLLTAELSKNPQLILLERNEIERVYREQGLSAENRDFLKLGQVLGADGLLLIRAEQASSAMPAFAPASVRPPKPKLDVRAQLIAVKPGVLLASEQFSAIEDVAQWATGFAAYLSPSLPKLTVLEKDAVPVSIVNLRAAMKSPETEELERQLTALAIERLSHERQLFVLERRKMELLASEKELKGLNDSAFWNGSYLLEGTIDRNGYARDTITLSARLVPPKGGAPVAIEVSGSRTNLSEVINRLAEKVCDDLKLALSVVPWNAADEAQKYFEEAKWALRWNLHQQAQSAVDSAWILGKQDMDCATLRIAVYSRSIPEIDPANLYHTDPSDKGKYAPITSNPQPEEIANALKLLQIYEQFGPTLPPEQRKFNSACYLAGIDALQKSTDVLRHYYFHPESQQGVSEQLADLRAESRRVADWISQQTGVRTTYWLDGRIPDKDHDELYHDFEERYVDSIRRQRNFYEAELRWGALWQDKPEDCCALYRTLMDSPLFAKIHYDLWFRNEETPRMTAWNVEDKARVPAVWQNFIVNLDNSTNAFLRMEAKLYAFTDAEMYRGRANEDWGRTPGYGQPGYRTEESINSERDQKMEAAWRGLFDFVFENYDSIVTGREILVFIGLNLGAFSHTGNAAVPLAEQLEEEFRKIDGPRITALQDEYKSRNDDRLKEIQNSPLFNQQKEYLRKLTPFERVAFNKLFNSTEFSKTQAAELKPLVEAYKSNMLASVPTNNVLQRMKTVSDISSIDSNFGRRLEETLALKTPAPVTALPTVTAPPVTVAQPSRPSAVAPKQPSPAPAQVPTNALVARKFLPIPTNQLPAKNIANLAVFSHRMRDGKLLLNLQYMNWWAEPWVDERGYTNSPHFQNYREAGAVLEPNGAWDVTPFPRIADSMAEATDFLQGALGISDALSAQLYVELFGDAIYVSDPEKIRHYDVRTKQWSELPFPGQERAQLYVVNNHLYAASSEGIWEILDDGQSSHILASVRRRPAASTLDSRDTLGKPVLFSGKDHALWAALNGEVFSWDGSDWKPVLKIDNVLTSPVILQGAAFFRTYRAMQSTELWRLSPNDTEPTLCLREAIRTPGRYGGPPIQRSINATAPLWKLPAGMFIAFNLLAVDGSTIYLLSLPVATNRTWTSDTMRNERPVEATLVCLAPESREALTIPIRFDTNAGPATVPANPGRGSGLWIECSTDSVFIGAAGWPGVWELPKSEIQAEMKRQIAERPPAKKEIVAQPEKAVLAKYDLNHDGQLDLEEWEAAISDPAFLEAEVDQIDLNKNDQLDLDELPFFDANKNGVLDEPELTGILAFQHILAAKVLKEYDVNRNGSLDRQEFEEFLRNKQRSIPGMMAMDSLPSSTAVGRIEHYLQYATEQEVQAALFRMIPGWSPQLFANDKRRAENLSQEINLYWEKETPER